MDVADHRGGVLAGSGREEPDAGGRGHHHARLRGEPRDPLVIGERADARPQRLVARLQRGAELNRAADARAELEHLDLHRDDPGEHQPEQWDPHASADDPVEQRMIRDRAHVRARPGPERDLGAAARRRARNPPAWRCRAGALRAGRPRLRNARDGDRAGARRCGGGETTPGGAGNATRTTRRRGTL